jgi:hypothetical protein
MSGLDYVVRWEGLPSIPAAMLTVKDHVNPTAIVSSTLGLTFAIDTLLCTAAIIQGAPNSAAFNLECRFSYRPNGWNSFYEPATGEWKRMHIHISTPDDTENYETYEYLNFPEADTDEMESLLP